MAKKCSKCGFVNNPDGSHYCGKCGSNIADSGVWKVYNWTVYGTFNHLILVGVMFLLFGLGSIGIIVIVWFFPELFDDIPPYKKNPFEFGGTIFLTVIMFFMAAICFLGAFGFFPSRKSNK